MIITDDSKKAIRERTQEIHCHEITIEQRKKENNIRLNGYGTIKSQENGSMYVEFICLKSNIFLDPFATIPEDQTNPNEKLYLEALSIEGNTFKSSGFALNSPSGNIFGNGPKRHVFKIIHISTSSKSITTPAESKSILIEVFGNYDIPKNISNKTESTLGTVSHSRNQTKLKSQDIEFSIVQYKTYATISIHSNAGISWERMKDAKDALIFYIEFSTGLLALPYLEIVTDSSNQEFNIFSFDLSLAGIRIPQPISSAVSDGKSTLDDHHFRLLFCLHRLITNNKTWFMSIQAQWRRIWHSFLSKEFRVPMLTLSVGVEGIINDIFTPALSEEMTDSDFEEKKSQIIERISRISDIDDEHKKTISRHVGNWGNPTPKKILDHLVKNDVINSKHLKNWERVRHSSAHPRSSGASDITRPKDIHRTIFCLRLFYILVMNVVEYSGHQVIYLDDGSKINTIVEHKKII
ncbi:MAG: hypothetical protein FH754_16875 [Marinobacter sp.]|nr:hypothetical protein [Marinobacter sp.]